MIATGYANLPERAPVLTVVVVAINLSLPMAAWMRFRGMAWRLNLCSPLVAGAPHHQHLVWRTLNALDKS